ncbi:hypothetical protein J3A83DRAFT_4367071 [Scleroderma citrinum]
MQGVEIERISPGDGKTFPKPGDTVTIHYVGTFTNGQTFDSSRDRGSPFKTQIGVGKVIKGWDEGQFYARTTIASNLPGLESAVPKLSLGEKAILTATPDYAYGEQGFGKVIPKNATLKFEVELLKIN